MPDLRAIKPFLDRHRRLRNGWWILLFFVVLAALVVPAKLLADARGAPVSTLVQLAIVAAVTAIVLAIRREPPSAVLGTPASWRLGAPVGVLLGGLIWSLTAGVLLASGGVAWGWSDDGGRSLLSGLAESVAVAAVEELLFRGFVFQRLVAGVGVVAAQIAMAAYFTLTHATGLGAAGGLQGLAMANIFLASLLFGLLYLRTQSLALPFGLHLGLNAMQGSILGFGVSGNASAGLLAPRIGDAPEWWTGGAFGLEASVPGTVAIAVALLLVGRWRPGPRFGGASTRAPR